MSFVWLPDGAPLLLRAIRSDDDTRIEAAWQRSSTESRRRRMHGTTGPLNRQVLTDLTHIDHRSHEAVVATSTASTCPSAASRCDRAAPSNRSWLTGPLSRRGWRVA
jgi:hypothetical protein